MFKPVDNGYCNSSEYQAQVLIVGNSLLNSQYQYKLNEDKPILEFIKTVREEKEKETKEKNLITDDLITDDL